MTPQTHTRFSAAPKADAPAPPEWHGIAAGALDIVFETDADGRLRAVAPATWLGRDTHAMLGQPFGVLWEVAPVHRPIAGHDPVRRVVHSVNDVGRSVALLLTYTPFPGPHGLPAGARGGLIRLDDDVTRDPLREIRQPDAPIMRRVVETLRAAVVPRIGIMSAFTLLAEEIGAGGAALLSTGPLSPHEPEPTDSAFHVLHRAGLATPQSDRVIADLVPGTRTGALRRSSGELDFLLARERIRHFGQIGLLFWRSTSAPWTTADGALCAAVASTFSALVEIDGVHRNLLREAHFDPSHNILTWPGLRSEIGRRTGRLDREHLAATLMLVAVEGLPALVSSLDFAEGDKATRQCIELLRTAVRPTDLIARIGADTFALWMDGGDRFAAAERAERVCVHGAPIILDPPHHLPVTIGLVSREAGTDESIEMFLERASLALRSAREKGGGWLFSNDAP